VQTDRPGAEPGWGAAKFPKADRSGRFVTLASGYEVDAEALKINSAARVLGATLAKGESAGLALDPARHAYLVATQGPILVNGVRAEARDGVAITGVDKVTVEALEDAEIVLVDAR
jgi:redox-sensitive bicupin YhaK (pirin superfamily)